MTIRIGYACINTELQSPNRTCRLSNATPDRLIELGRENLLTLQLILRWNISRDVHLFRISSETIPFGSHPVNNLPWWEVLAPELDTLAGLIRSGSLRVSMHPGQFTVLNSPRPEVVENSIAELVYHERLLTAMGTDRSHKIVLHLGGTYGDKPASKRRFIDAFQRLPETVQSRLLLENDEKNYSLADAIEVSHATGAPVVFDVFHHRWNPSFEGESLLQLIERAGQTWGQSDGRQKMHYSDQWPGKQPGSHSNSVDLAAFQAFYEQVRHLPLDIMLEVKDKEQSVLKLYDLLPELRKSS